MFFFSRVSLELSDSCHLPNSAPLAISVAQVVVNFTSGPSESSDFTQNDSSQLLGGSGLSTKLSFRKNGRSSKTRPVSKKSVVHETSGDITGIPLRDDSSKVSRTPTHYGPIRVGFEPDKGWTFSTHNQSLEAAMYVLLGVFSVAILVFVASCFVYASRVKKREGFPPDEFGLMPVATKIGDPGSIHGIPR